MKHNERRDIVAANNKGFGLFDPFFEDFFDIPSVWDRRMNKAGSLMKTDIKETADSYVLDIDMPGIDKKDIGIELRDGYLTVSAKKEESSEEKGEHHYLRRERSYGACSRSFYVGEIEDKDVDAKLENGILTITVPKKDKPEDNGAKRIDIR